MRAAHSWVITTSVFGASDFTVCNHCNDCARKFDDFLNAHACGLDHNYIGVTCPQCLVLLTRQYTRWVQLL